MSDGGLLALALAVLITGVNVLVLAIVVALHIKDHGR